MSLQFAIAFAQPELSKSGQLVRLPQPIDDSGSSSPPVPQILSAPPHALLMLNESLLARTVRIAAVLVSLAQTVVAGNWPFCFAVSHFWRVFARPCTYFEEAFAMPCSHLTGSATTQLAVPSTIAPMKSAAETERTDCLVILPLLRARLRTRSGFLRGV
jgi:hypothetical protein